ncbi:MAG: protein kinase domain-containing protein [Vicinamibacteraceae bacterium]
MTAPDLIAQKFRIKNILGRGGMGEVYLATDETLGSRRVALKLLRIDEEEMRKRFEQEARAAANLQHRNIITIYEYGQHGGQPYIAMEFVSGATLAAVIGEQRPLSLATRLELIEQACSGVAHAHSQGIIHRDIKPSNLIVDHEGRLRILDFGIAHVPTANLTRGPAMMGTPNYMSPEQINGDPLDRRSDVFSLGLVLYELLAHRQAFPGESARVLDRIRFEEAPWLTFSPGGALPREVVSIVERALQKHPDDRYQNLLEMQTDIRRARGGTGVAWSNAQVPTTVVVKPPTRGTPGSGPLAHRRRELAQRRLLLGRKAIEQRDYVLAVEELEQAVALDESHTEAAALLEQARRRLDEQRAENVARFLADAERQFARGELTAARTCVEEARSLDPESSHVVELSETIALAETEAHLQSCLERAQSALAAGELSRCAALLDEAGQVRADAPGLVELRHQLDEAYAARARERRLQRAVAQGRADLERQEIARALRAADAALLEDPDYHPARQLREDALAAQPQASDSSGRSKAEADGVSALEATAEVAVGPLDDDGDTRPILVSELQRYARQVTRAPASATDVGTGPSWRDRLTRLVAAISGTFAGRKQA